MTPTTIDAGLCLLRPWRPTDRAALLRHANNRKVWRNLRDIFPHPYTERDADQWLARSAVNPPPWLFAIEVDGEAAGTIALQHRPDVEKFSAEMGYWLGEAFWGRGIMTAAVKAFTREALAQPDLCRIEAPVFSWNPASMRVLEKAGYRREGTRVRGAFKDNTLIDMVLYAITRDPGIPYVPFTEPAVPFTGPAGGAGPQSS